MLETKVWRRSPPCSLALTLEEVRDRASYKHALPNEGGLEMCIVSEVTEFVKSTLLEDSFLELIAILL